MSAGPAHSSPGRKPDPIATYYRRHAGIYDATRWSFLFGRAALLKEVAATTSPVRILEVGCGTGKNLAGLARRFPQAAITGLDLSAPMLAVARRKLAPFGSRVGFLHRSYDAPLNDLAGYDLVLFSYALSMFNPGYEQAIRAADADLAPGGCIAVVDFHNTPSRLFERWMGVNHVRMNGQLRPILQSLFEPQVDHVDRAYGGMWRYMTFIGRKRPAHTRDTKGLPLM